MSRSASRNQVLLFGLLGALGCLGGAALGEGWINSIKPLKPEDAQVRSVSIVEPPEVSAPRPTAVKPVAPPADPPADLTRRRDTPAPELPPELRKALDKAGAHVGFIEIALEWHDHTDLD